VIDPKAQIHAHALIDEGAVIGPGTRVWAFAHVLSGAVIGADCNICDHTFIEGNVKVGDRVTVKCGVYLWDGVTVEDDVFIGPAAVFTNDLRPRSRRRPSEFARTLLCRGASIGASAVLLPGIQIGRWAMVGAGAVVTRSVPDHALVVGNPARQKGWVCLCGESLSFSGSGGEGARCACGLAYRHDPEALRIKEAPP
jgi:UDP-2-acetamido-3-amino-2,3-dideoxy-glucuronate N-acetyltransferase